MREIQLVEHPARDRQAWKVSSVGRRASSVKHGSLDIVTSHDRAALGVSAAPEIRFPAGSRVSDGDSPRL